MLLAPVFLQFFDHLAIFARIHHVEPRPLAGGLASGNGLPLRGDRAVEIFQVRIVQPQLLGIEAAVVATQGLCVAPKLGVQSEKGVLRRAQLYVSHREGLLRLVLDALAVLQDRLQAKRKPARHAMLISRLTVCSYEDVS